MLLLGTDAIAGGGGGGGDLVPSNSISYLYRIWFPAIASVTCTGN